ncbi:phosphatases II [Phlegmacium glaucopus]|nr:phosphatases II [Phlegmacium glaucopus]
MPTSLCIEPPAQIQQIALALGSDSSDSDYPPKPCRNMKKLSLSLPSAQSSVTSFLDPPAADPVVDPSLQLRPPLPVINSFLLRKDEDSGSPSVPYIDGPVQIIPGIWIGSEDNALDWKGLVERGIRSILNVAKEVNSPLDSSFSTRALKPAISSPNLRNRRQSDPTYHPPHFPTGRPAMYYLKLQWSHGQQNLVNDGFQAGMAFADAALKRGEGCLIHCQCGISRSATMVIAIVMRAAAEHAAWVPPEVWALKGMQGAYAFVKEKSPCVGPNMSLIYQLMEYEKKLKGVSGYLDDSDGSSGTDEEEEWGRQRKLLDETSNDDLDQRESNLVMQEARALDKAMEDRIVARKSSASSMSSTGSGIGMGAAWRSRYAPRKRTESIASNRTTSGSFLSEHLVEEDEEQELLGVGGDFDHDVRLKQVDESSITTSPDEGESTSQTASIPTSLLTTHPPDWKASFTPPMTAMRSTFQLPTRPPLRQKKRPLSLNILPPVPSSPIALITEEPVTARPAQVTILPARQRAESRRLAPPPLHLRNSVLRRASMGVEDSTSAASTPSQTLFVFPPSPNLMTRTPSTMTLTSNFPGAVPFPSMSTPRVSTFQSKGRTRSFIGLGAPPTPTVAFSKVDARGYVGLG